MNEQIDAVARRPFDFRAYVDVFNKTDGLYNEVLQTVAEIINEDLFKNSEKPEKIEKIEKKKKSVEDALKVFLLAITQNQQFLYKNPDLYTSQDSNDYGADGFFNLIEQQISIRTERGEDRKSVLSQLAKGFHFLHKHSNRLFSPYVVLRDKVSYLNAVVSRYQEQE
jgi:hypothetical protein